MYNSYQIPNNYNNSLNRPYNNNNYSNNDNRLIGGGFLGPFILGGITGGLVSPFFYGNGYGRPYYNNNYYYPYPPRPFPPYRPYYR